MKAKLLRLGGILTAVSAALAAGALVYETVSIYRAGLASGAQMYTYETIGKAFGEIAPVLWAFIGLSLIMLLARAFTAFRSSSRVSPDTAFDFMRLRVDMDAPELKNELRLQNRVSVIGAAVMLLCVLATVLGVFSGEHFTTTDLETEMQRFLPLLILPTLMALICAYVVLIVTGLSRRRCLEVMKALPRHPVAAENEHGKVLLWTRITLLVLAAVFIVLGILNGGLHDVLVKAINICTECIGLG